MWGGGEGTEGPELALELGLDKLNCFLTLREIVWLFGAQVYACQGEFSPSKFLLAWAEWSFLQHEHPVGPLQLLPINKSRGVRYRVRDTWSACLVSAGHVVLYRHRWNMASSSPFMVLLARWAPSAWSPKPILQSRYYSKLGQAACCLLKWRCILKITKCKMKSGGGGGNITFCTPKQGRKPKKLDPRR